MVVSPAAKQGVNFFPQPLTDWIEYLPFALRRERQDTTALCIAIAISPSLRSDQDVCF